MDYCYDYKSFLIKEILIEEKIYEVKAIYSAELGKFLEKMLSFEERSRPNYRELWKEVQRITKEKGLDFSHVNNI
jgi:hypothetical protein